MFFSILFDKYYQQIASVLLHDYKKTIGKIDLTDICKSLEIIRKSEFNLAIEQSNYLIQKFKTEYQVTFKPLTLPEQTLKEKIKQEVELEWANFFKTMSILIDNHDFYKAIETKFKLVYQGTVNATKILARDLKLIANVQTLYKDASKIGKSREALIINLNYLTQKSKQLFTNYYHEINSLRNDVENYSQQTINQFSQLKEKLGSPEWLVISLSYERG